MRLSLSLLLPVMVGAAHAAASPSLEGYIFTSSQPQISETFDLTPEEVRLVLAQQLDVTQYHSLTSTSSSPHELYNRLSYLDILGGEQRGLFADDVAESSSPKRLVIWADYSTERISNLKASWSSRGWESPSFRVQPAPRRADVNMLVRDMQRQILGSLDLPKEQCKLEALLDLSDECWHRKNSHIMINDLFETVEDQKHLFKVIDAGLLEVTFLISPHGRRSENFYGRHPWGTYSMPPGVHERRLEAPMTDSSLYPISTSSDPSLPSSPDLAISSPPHRGLPALCHVTLDACTNATSSCSGHGSCVRKFGPSAGESGPSCFTCACKAFYDKDRKLTTYWGGAACQKRDVSAQFWIIAGFSALLVGLVAWAVGLMFSVGAEKLPGVIGAGVAPKTR